MQYYFSMGNFNSNEPMTEQPAVVTAGHSIPSPTKRDSNFYLANSAAEPSNSDKTFDFTATCDKQNEKNCKIIGDYKVFQSCKLGNGAYGAVFKGTHKDNGIKVIASSAALNLGISLVLGFSLMPKS